MKVVHITESYIEGWGYQENLLPLYQKRAGDDVVVISDNNHLGVLNNQPALRDEIINRGNEYSYGGIKVYKIQTKFNKASTSFYCTGLLKILEYEKPNMIFHHNVGMSTLTVATRYKKKHPDVKLYVDNHADWINVSKNLLWRKLYYRILAPLQIRKVDKYVDYYIGVSPLRCQFLSKVFKAPQKKIRFLPIGCDTEQSAQIKENRNELKKRYGFGSQSYVVVSGGKIDRTKGTLTLIDACVDLRKDGGDVNLVLFGKIDEEVHTYASQCNWITELGWCDRATTLSLLKMADVACWPWLHTTLIEDSVTVGTPLVVKMSDNVRHFAKEQAGVFLESGSKLELISAIKDVMSNGDRFKSNVLKARDKYSYATLVQILDNETFCEF